MAQIKVALAPYGGWENCLHIDNGKVRLVVTTDVGPRIIHFGAVDGANLFHQNRAQQGMVGGSQWRIYGGHRLWHSPQVGYRPNQPDNASVAWERTEFGVRLTAPEEQLTRVQKVIQVELAQDMPCVRVHHEIHNRSPWPVELAPWALTVMREGGLEVFPLPREDTLFLPNYAISFWPWTRPNDPRFTLGEKYMFLRQDERNERWFKIGYRNTEGWGAYFRDGCMFVKRYAERKGARYPDYGSTFETYTDAFFIELESLGPLENVAPDEYVAHDEEWALFRDVVLPQSEADVDQYVLPRIEALRQGVISL